MSPFEFIRKQLASYFIVVTIITFVIGILGLLYEPNQRFGYEAYFSPFLFGFIGVVPSWVTYSKKELTVKQMRVRIVLQFLLLEGMILSFTYMAGLLRSEMIGSMAFSVFAVFVAVHVIEWFINKRAAEDLTVDLKAYQEIVHRDSL